MSSDWLPPRQPLLLFCPAEACGLVWPSLTLPLDNKVGIKAAILVNRIL